MVRSFLGVISLGLLLIGCASTPQVSTDYNSSYNFSNLKSFTVKDIKQESKESLLISPFTFNHIRDLLNAELGKRYQSSVDDKAVDFIVSYHIVMEEKIDPRVYDDLYGFGYWGRGYRYPSPYFMRPSYGTTISVYNQGSLIVDMVDAKTQEPIWRGVSEKRLSKGMSPQQQREILTGALLEILAQFPPVK